jgi:hypothetical protein
MNSEKPKKIQPSLLLFLLFMTAIIVLLYFLVKLIE